MRELRNRAKPIDLTPPPPPDPILLWHTALAEHKITPEAFSLDRDTGLHLRFRRTFFRDTIIYELRDALAWPHGLWARVFVTHTQLAATDSMTWVPSPDGTYAAAKIGGKTGYNAACTAWMYLKVFLIEARQLVLGEAKPIVQGNAITGHYRRGQSLGNAPKVVKFDPVTNGAIVFWTKQDAS